MLLTIDSYNVLRTLIIMHYNTEIHVQRSNKHVMLPDIIKRYYNV